MSSRDLGIMPAMRVPGLLVRLLAAAALFLVLPALSPLALGAQDNRRAPVAPNAQDAESVDDAHVRDGHADSAALADSIAVRHPFTRALANAQARNGSAGVPPRLDGSEPRASVRVDTIPPDSMRARILETLRRRDAPPDTEADTLGAEEDGLRLPPGRQATPGRGGRPAAGSTIGTGGDTIMEALLRLPGYTVSRYEGERMEFSGETRRLDLFGSPESNARFLRDDLDLSAENRIVYSEIDGRVRTIGPSVLTAQGSDPVASSDLVYDLALARGSVRGAQTRYSQGATDWYVSGDLPAVESGTIWGHGNRFTSCDHEVPHSHFETGELKIIADNVLVARNVRLYFADVPVFWLPFMAQTLGDGRGSGLLTPRFSVNDIIRTSRGQSRRVSNIGFYWAMSNYSDATIALDWWSGNYVAATGSIRYNWLQQFLQGDLNYRQFWREDGGQEIAFDSRHRWEIDERTRFGASLAYASSSQFVRQNTFDPREVTQSINSEMDLSRRFGWGNLNTGASRRQFLSDDRVEMRLPGLSLSLSPITLFSAPAARASWYHNMTWSGSGNVTRNTVDRLQVPGTPFRFEAADERRVQGSANSSLNLGFLSWSQSVSYSDVMNPDVPESFFPQALPPIGGPADTLATRDFGRSLVNWSTGLNYRQRLIGTTTITPQVTIAGEAIRSDTMPEALNFVSGPMRVTFGAALNTDIFGFYPGFGNFSAIRHKMTPNISYGYTPPSDPTALQQRVFNAQELQPRNQVTIGVNQTFEAKVPGGGSGRAQVDADTTGDGPRRQPRDQIVNLLALRTSAVTYDFVRADSLGFFSSGFTTTRLSNQVSSDFLRGLSLSFEHDLFEDAREGAQLSGRSFSPHLSQLNLSFAVGSRSSLVQRIFNRGQEAPEPLPEDVFDEEEDEFAPRDGLDENRVLPGRRRDDMGGARRGRTSLGEWNANISYSLRRPREIEGQTATSQFLTAQMVQATLSFKPTSHWDVNWRTSYDIESGQFNDHMIRLSRDLHEWEASFDFQQTATGNWSFRFEVSLIANRDLKFDFQQRGDTATPTFP